MLKSSNRGSTSSAITTKNTVAPRPRIVPTGQTRTTSASLRSATLTTSTSARSSLLVNNTESEMSTSLHVAKSTVSTRQKSSPWFWRRKTVSRPLLVRSVSTNKDTSGSWASSGNADRPSLDEAYESKTSTLSSAVTVDEVRSSCANANVARSASTREAKGTGGFLRFLRSSFASRTKKSPEVRPGTPPLSMTHSGLECLASKQASIAKVFADPNNRISRISQYTSDATTFNNTDSLDSQDSLSNSDDNQRFPRTTRLDADILCFPNEAIITSKTPDKPPPPAANRKGGRSHSANTRPIHNHVEPSFGIIGRAVNVYSNGVDLRTSGEQTRNPAYASGYINGLQRPAFPSSQNRTFCDGYSVGRYEGSSQMGFRNGAPTNPPSTSPKRFEGTAYQTYYSQSHFNYTFSEGKIYDQPPLSEPIGTPRAAVRLRTHSNSHQRLNNVAGSPRPLPACQILYEGPQHKMIFPVPATAPAVRRSFGRNGNSSNYESEDASVEEEDDEEEEGERAGGTLSRQKPTPPSFCSTNHYSRESLHRVDAHEKTPVPMATASAMQVYVASPVPNLPQPAPKSKARLGRRQTVGAPIKSIQPITTPNSTPTTPFEGSLHLKRVARPDLENERHRDTSLRITIHESKNLPSHQRYFCDICLDRKLYARTTSKLSKETVFWGEFFDLNNLAELNFITINLYREADSTKEPSKRRKSNKGQNQLVAFLTLAVADLTAKHETQRWHAMTPASMLPSNESLSTAPLAQIPSSRQSAGFFSLTDAVSTLSSPDSSANMAVTSTAAKRSISVAGSTPFARMRKLSRQTLGGSDTKMNGSSFGSASAGNMDCLPQIRLAVQYQSIDVLPLGYYDDLRKLVVDKSLPFVQHLEPLLQTKRKEEIARCLVNIHEKAPESNIATFLASLVDRELDSYDNLSLLFRSNSIGSKAVESYIKLVGTEYLQRLFRGFIESLIASPEDLEVDPSRLAHQTTTTTSLSTSDGSSSSASGDVDSTLQRNQTALTNLVKAVWQRLQASLEYFPADLRETLASIRRTVELRHGKEVGDQLVSGCLFLRYLCPAIHGPTLFGLTNAIPDDPRVSRNLTLLAKVLQTIANFSHFEAKENYMRFLNGFVQSMQEEMHHFLRAVSTYDDGPGAESDIWKKRKANTYNCHGNIDLGYELTILYRHLVSILEEHPKVPEVLSELPEILTSISLMFSTPPLRRSISGLGGSMRLSTTPSLDDSAAARRAAAFRFHSSTTPPVIDGLQPIPAEQSSTPVSFYTPGNDFTPKCTSSEGLRGSSFENSPVLSECQPRQQVFFGENFESNGDPSRGDLESISETEGQSTKLVPTTPPPPASQPIRPPQGVRSEIFTPLQRSSSRGALLSAPRISTLRGSTTLPSQKTSTGTEPVVLNFPPPPASIPTSSLVPKDAGLGGSPTNIRMGTRALRMSRERDLTGNLETDEKRGSIQISTVPVILQCDKSTAAAGRMAGSVQSVESTSSSSSLSLIPASGPSTTNTANQSAMLLAENPHYFEAPRNEAPADQPTFMSTPASVQRRYRGDSASNNPALLNKVHSLLFGEGQNEYQNVQGMTRIYPEHQSLESSNLEALERRLRAMEDHLSKERKDIQSVVASNMRIIDSQERCINDLIEEINRLQALRHNPDASSSKRATSTTTTTPPHLIDMTSSLGRSVPSPQRQPPSHRF
uniref:Ras-GAP domain-containing protein n=2 Tax=Mesocestoides corti TaxID=53468 RepID=A0A5K3EVP2_MESCO